MIATEPKQVLPRFREEVLVDCTAVPSYYDPDRDPVYDPQAGRVAKERTSEHKEWTSGYRLHIIVDFNWELPIAKEATLVAHNEKEATLLLVRQMKGNLPRLSPHAILAEKAYDKYEHYEPIVGFLQTRKRNRQSRLLFRFSLRFTLASL